MNLKTNRRILLFVMGFYILIVIFAITFGNAAGSNMYNREGIDLYSITSGEEEGVIESEDDFDNKNKLEGLEALSANENNKTKENSEPDQSASDTTPDYLVSRNSAVSDNGVSENAVSENSVNGDTVSGNDGMDGYYAFTSNNSEGKLRMRSEPNAESTIMYELNPGTEGYIIELGDEWSLVYANDHKGYCSNEFLTLREIPEEEYPEELKGGP
ncbi:MAG: SH3 domain-containing protein [Lachnospiraceae bacterium]|nr:SH3 domain-containing protein [Lachnospiraceae bacterium]